MAQQPIFSILIDGTDHSANFKSRLLHCRVVDNIGTDSDTCEVAVSDEYGRLVIPERFALMSVSMGWNGANVQLGSYGVQDIIVSGSGADAWSMIVIGSSAMLVDKLKGTRSEHHEDTTLGAIVGKVAERNGMQAKVAPGLAQIAVPYVAQSEESDMHLITRLAGQHGGRVAIKDQNVVVSQRGQEGHTISGAEMNFRVGANEILAHRAHFQGRPLFGDIVARWRDNETQTEKRVTEPGTGGGSQTLIVPQIFATESEARDAARSRSAATKLKADLSLHVHGRPDIRAGGTVTVVGLRSGVDGTWNIERVEHVLNQNGFVTRIAATTDTLGGSPDPGRGIFAGE